MATISAAITTPSISRATLVQKRVSSPVLGGKSELLHGGKAFFCEGKQLKHVGDGGIFDGSGAMSGPAMALVDERLSTEGTGLPFGLSNNLLGWILFGVFGLIWTLYFVYTSTLEEDEESGLSL
ncbi:Photosystem II reaction center W protein, chloroplastic [Glycine soja]|uniref:PSII 6.1 kDa protein n=1 Tax=Glycine soja TaxID=3848 RepID=A0A0B2RGF3_GLYSO|nr:Photosystem II reaction center W protein, chloroplastic [Glycine soja]